MVSRDTNTMRADVTITICRMNLLPFSILRHFNISIVTALLGQSNDSLNQRHHSRGLPSVAGLSP